MASITKRGDFWRAQVRRIGYPDVSSTFDTRTEAEAWAQDVEAQMTRGQYRPLGDAPTTTLHEALDRYYLEVGACKRHPSQELQRVRHWQRQALAERC
jgi:hypothetical protein